MNRRLLLFGLFLVLIVELMRPFSMKIMPGVSYKNLVLYLLVVYLGLRAATSPQGVRFRDLDVHSVFLAYLIYIFLTWAVAGALDPTYNSWSGFVAMKGQWVDYYLLFLIFRYGVQSLEDTIWLLKACTLTLLVITVPIFMDYVNLPDLGFFPTHKGRVEGLMQEANQYGGFLVFFMPTAFAMLAIYRPRPAWFWRLTLILCLFLLLATGSRGAWVSALGAAVLGTLYLRRYVNARAIFRVGGQGLLALTILGALGVVIFDLWFILERLFSFERGFDNASSGRIEIWSTALRVMREWPWSFVVGYGWNSFGESGLWISAHSEYLNALYEIGAIGLVLLVGVLAVVMSRSRAALRTMPREFGRLQIAYIYGTMALLIDIVFVEVPAVWSLFWIFTGLMMTVQAHCRDAAAGEAQPAPEGEPPAPDSPSLPRVSAYRGVGR